MDMTRPRPQYLQKQINRHGNTVWYVRKGTGKRIRIRGEYGSEEFMRNYSAAISGAIVDKPKQANSASLSWLIKQYCKSGAWFQLSETTKIQRNNIFIRVGKENGHLPFIGITRKNIASGRDKRAETPFAANNFLKAMRGLFGWAEDAGHITENPTLGVKALRTKTDGFHEWSEEEVAAFEAKWPIGTRERLALAILLYAGLRRGDAYTLGRQHVRNGVIYLRTEKKGVPVSLPIHPELQRAIDATTIGAMAFIAKENGQPLNKYSFGNWFRKACQAAGVPGSAHGLRKAAAIRWAYAGATESQLMAWFGWTDPKMASLYTKRANRESLARNMFETLNANSIPSPKTHSPSPEAKQLKNKG